MASPLFSIVVTGYQNGPYLDKALSSIAEQSYGDFEVLCYVEKSTDNSLDICQSFSQKDNRFKTITAEKSGSAAATRNYGIENATGEYLLALDGDDWFAPEMLQQLATKLDQTGPLDVLAFVGQKMVTNADGNFDASDIVANFTSGEIEGVISGEEALHRVARKNRKFYDFTWLNLYRLSFLREHKLLQTYGRFFEDYEWTPRVWFFAKRLTFMDEVFYLYRIREGSLTKRMMTSNIFFDMPFQIRQLARFALENHVPADILSFWGNQWFIFLFWILFQPENARQLSKERRVEALRILLNDGGADIFKKIMRFVSRPKRMAFPFMRLGAKGWLFPADCFFRFAYYPLTQLREKMHGQKG